VRRTIIPLLSCMAWTTCTAGEPPPYPGCDVDREVESCLEDSGNSYDMLRCYKPALARLEADLDARLARFRRDNRDTRPALVAKVDAAQGTWRLARDADCGAVSAAWQGGSGQRGAIIACLYEHTLARSRWVWRWYEDWGDGDGRCPDPGPSP
jgi:uncharacterized protein YecT (DUF1311 family)